MLTLLQSAGGYFSSKRKQINKVNYYAEKINLYYLSDAEKALTYAHKLCAYYAKLNDEKSPACLMVEEWFITNPPSLIKEKIEQLVWKEQLRLKIQDLSQKAQLPNLYRNYEGKDSFRTLIQNTLEQFDEEIQVTTIKSANNPIVHVQSEQSKFIIRFLTVSSQHDHQGAWPRRELLANIKQIPKPFLLEPVTANEMEVLYFEFGEHYENGNLEEHFQRLRRNKTKKLISPNDFYNVLFVYAKKIIELYIEINQRGIWFTDLKPSNILLDNYNEIVISDIKGLILCLEGIIRANETATTKSYHQSSVFITQPDDSLTDDDIKKQKKNWINLHLLQQQTLGTTLYHLATGKLPLLQEVFDKENPDSWILTFDFSLPIFKSGTGLILKKLIIKLHDTEALDMDELLKECSDNIKSEEQPIRLDEDIIEIAASPRIGRNPSRPSI